MHCGYHRGRKATAPLKREFLRRADLVFGISPWPKGYGPIEALNAILDDRARVFPHHRGRKATAPLKPYDPRCPDVDQGLITVAERLRPH